MIAADEAMTPTVVPIEGESILTLEHQKTIDKLTKQLHKYLQNTISNLVEIGRDLIKVKELIGHGKFLIWLEKEFELSDQTARRFMHVAEVFGDRLDALKNLSLRSVYVLAAPSTPEEVREALFKRIEAGEELTFDLIQSMCQKPESLVSGGNGLPSINETSFNSEVKKVNKKLKGWGEQVEQKWKRLEGTLTQKSKQELETLHSEVAQLTQLLGSLLEQTKEAPKQSKPINSKLLLKQAIKKPARPNKE